jgi:iron complex outermembrane recepter protein
MDTRVLFSTTAYLAFVIAAASPAVAQGDDRSQHASAEATTTPKDIVVTGSRIARRDFVSDSPIATVDATSFKQTGQVTLEDTLNRLPQIVPARGATSNDGLTGGITTIDLRGLGSNRTLVLMDSRRLQAATPLGQVDINNIPPALLQNVEIVTGGASAAYGSDAIAGVVNFKINHRFTGVQIDAQNGVTSRGDGFSTQESVTAGGTFLGGRGHAEISATYSRRDGIPNSARGFSTIVRPSSSLTTGAYIADAGNLPTETAVNGVFGRYGYAAGTAGASSNLAFNMDGSLFSYQQNDANFHSPGFGLIDTPTGVRFNSSGVAGLTIPYQRTGVYAHTDVDVTEALNLYAEGNYAHFTSLAYYAPGLTDIDVPLTNPFIPADLRAILATRADSGADIDVRRRFAEVGDRIAMSATDTFQFRAGAKGRIGIGDWTYDIYGSYGRTDDTQRNRNGISVSALQTLASATDGGASLCAGGLNLFGLDANSACAGYIRRNTVIRQVGEQKVAEATIQGSLFALPAGDVQFAVGADYRDDSFRYSPDEEMRSGDLLSFTNGAVSPVSGSVRAKEAYAELSVPILADLPFVKKLALDAGYRYSNYNAFGGVSSFRMEGDWQIASVFRLRGGFARAVRAPSISELYAPTSQSSPEIGTPGATGQGDPCDVRSAYRTGPNASSVRQLCLAQGVPASIIDSYIFDSGQIIEGGVTGGNRKLRPEVADTYTIGGVLTPKLANPIFSRLSLSADYFNVNLKHAVGLIDGGTAIQKCYDLDGSNGSYSAGNYFCSLFARSPSTGAIDFVAEYELNLGKVKTSGVDLALDWAIDLDQAFPGAGGTLRLQGSATWLRSYDVQLLPGGSSTHYAGSIGYDDGDTVKALPRWKATINLNYTLKTVTLGLQYRYIAGMVDASVVGTGHTAGFQIPAFSYFDLNSSVKISDRLQMRAGVNNLADKKPPVFASFDQSNTLPGVYDVFGRSFYVGVSAKF